MEQHGYRTVFEIGVGTFPWSTVSPPLIFLVAGLLPLRFPKGKRIYVVFGLIMSSIAALIFAGYLLSCVPEFIQLRNEYLSGKGSAVEGVVENFYPAPAIGPARESFSVHGTSFSYNVLDVTPCFHDAPLHGGIIREGLPVRVHYNGRCIQRVDVLEAK
jgi:hypothetical protein